MANLVQKKLDEHVARLLQCRRCPRMIPPPVSGGPVVSRVILVGQAPGVREPVLGKPFAWTAGRTLFGWFNEFCKMTEADVRSRLGEAIRTDPRHNPVLFEEWPQPVAGFEDWP